MEAYDLIERVPWFDMFYSGILLWVAKRLVDRLESMGQRVTAIEVERQMTKDTGVCTPIQRHEEIHHGK